jgi:hypothetical protein
MRDFAKTILRRLLIYLCRWANIPVATADEQIVPSSATLLPAGFSMFDDRLAAGMGLQKAIVYQKIAGWTLYNERRASAQHRRDGRWWTYGSYNYWQSQMPWWSESTVKRHLADLVDDGWLSADVTRDGVRWYTPSRKSRTVNLHAGGSQTGFGGCKLTAAAVKLDSARANCTPYNSKHSSRNQALESTSGTTTPPARAGADAPISAVVVQSVRSGSEIDWLAEDEPVARESAGREGDEGHDDRVPDAGTPPPVALAPSPPEWARTFFTGCTAEEVARLIDSHGEERVRERVKYARSQTNLHSPAGFVRWALLNLGSAPMGGNRTLTGTDYVTGPYASFIEH